MNDNFTTVFLFTNETSGASFGSVVVIIVGIWGLFLVAVYMVWQSDQLKSGAKSPIQFAFTSFIAMLLALFVFGAILQGLKEKTSLDAQFQQFRGIYENQQYIVVEGPVHVLHQQSAMGHDRGDVVVVGGTTFEISYFSSGYGYKYTIAHGGTLREGVYAKIYYTNEGLFPPTILRIDIREEP
jgi:hypothetical protein